MLKKYQVAETKSDKWIVVKTCAEILTEEGNKIIGDIESIDYTEYNTAAEAQERADELNEEHGYEVMQDNNHNPK